MAAEAAGRDDATAGPSECTEMEERVRCFSFRMLSLQKTPRTESSPDQQAFPVPAAACCSKMEKKTLQDARRRSDRGGVRFLLYGTMFR